MRIVPKRCDTLPDMGSGNDRDDRLHRYEPASSRHRKKPNRTLGYEGEWRAKVVGADVETGSQVTVAYYDRTYTHAADAKCRASQLLKHLKGK